MTNWHNEFQKELDGLTAADIAAIDAVMEEKGCQERILAEDVLSSRAAEALASVVAALAGQRCCGGGCGR